MPLSLCECASPTPARRGALPTRICELARVPGNTFRTWDSGLRPTPLYVVTRGREVLASRAKRNELMPPIDWPRNWACISAHFRLRHAQADWRRNSRYAPLSDARSVPHRAAGEQFLARGYCRFSGQAPCLAPVPTVPHDYDERLRNVRRRRGLTQDALARRIGAAGKAVVYQWESRKRRPSPVLWQRLLENENDSSMIRQSTLRRCPTRQLLRVAIRFLASTHHLFPRA
jgi:DNA-binding XRE family transcriptional regulator